jgi:tRNA dimethylallyltransferase
MLCEKDPESAKVIHENNVKRVVRALEILHLSGKKKSDQKQEEKKFYKKSIILGIRHERNVLYERINKRVDIMIEQGLEAEVRNFFDMGISKDNNALQAIGYKEWIDYFNGKISLDDCIYNIKLNSRHYAKRQLTWFNKMDLYWVDAQKETVPDYNYIFTVIKKKFFNS